MDSVRKLGCCLLLLVTAGSAGCAQGPVVAREVLSDPTMHFPPGRPIASPGTKQATIPETEPMPPDTIEMDFRLSTDPGQQVQGTWLASSLRGALELFAGIGLEAGYGLSLDRQLIQKLDGFTGPLEWERTRHGPDVAVVLDDGTSILRAGYSYRTAWDETEHSPSISARTSVLRRDTVVEVGYRRSFSKLIVPDSRNPAADPIDEDSTIDRLHAAVEQGFLPGWNIRLEVAVMLENGFLQSPYRLVSLWAHRPDSDVQTGTVPRTEPESHPDSRFRWGTLLRVKRALPFLSSVVELGAGHGSGTWRVEHSVALLNYLQRIGDRFTLSLGGGAYHQTAASFYQDDYTAGPPGAFWSADSRLCSHLDWWGELGLMVTIIPQRGRVIGIFKYLTIDARFRLTSADYSWEGLGSGKGFTSYPSLAAANDVTRFEGGMTFGGWLGIEGGF